jgi:hypothetical protein
VKYKKYVQRGGELHAYPESESSSEGAFERTPITEPTPTAASDQPLLGDLLVASGVVSEEEMRSAVAEGLRTGERLGEVVVRNGWASDERVAELLAEQWRLPFLRTDALSIDPVAMRRIPIGIARELDAVPIGFAAHGLLLAIAEPSRELFSSVEERIGGASYVVIARSALDSLLRSRLLTDSPSAPASASFESPHAPSEPATTTPGEPVAPRAPQIAVPTPGENPLPPSPAPQVATTPFEQPPAAAPPAAAPAVAPPAAAPPVAYEPVAAPPVAHQPVEPPPVTFAPPPVAHQPVEPPPVTFAPPPATHPPVEPLPVEPPPVSFTPPVAFEPVAPPEAPSAPAATRPQPLPPVDTSAVFRSVDAATHELNRVRHEVAELAEALARAHAELAEQRHRLAEADATRESDTALIRRLESELWKRGDLFKTLKEQVDGLSDVLDAGSS